MVCMLRTLVGGWESGASLFFMGSLERKTQKREEMKIDEGSSTTTCVTSVGLRRQ
jgi:hypothetical protein